MKIVEPSAELIWATEKPAEMIEKIARVCYKSEDHIEDGSAAKMVAMLVNRNHTAMLEHASASIKFTTDRGISHELVRHRMASFAQESTRYCNYNKTKFGAEITVVVPSGLNAYQTSIWEDLCLKAEYSYLKMLENGAKPQQARSVLPNSLKTEIVVTANFREWLHIIDLRTSKAAHPDIQIIINQAKLILANLCPELFADKE